jgi:hypothetical protein
MDFSTSWVARHETPALASLIGSGVSSDELRRDIKMCLEALSTQKGTCRTLGRKVGDDKSSHPGYRSASPCYAPAHRCLA